MGAVPDGDYYIQLVGTPLLAGANAGDTAPVTLGGVENIWSVKYLGLNQYTLTLKESERHAIVDNLSGVVVIPQPGNTWKITSSPSGSHLIEEFGIVPSKAWTANTPFLPGSKINAENIGAGNQSWYFNKAPPGRGLKAKEGLKAKGDVGRKSLY